MFRHRTALSKKLRGLQFSIFLRSHVSQRSSTHGYWIRSSIFSSCSWYACLCASSQNWKSNGLRSGECAGQEIGVVWLITRPLNFLKRNSLAKVLQWRGGFNLAATSILFLLPWILIHNADHTKSCNRFRFKELHEHFHPLASFLGRLTGILLIDPFISKCSFIMTKYFSG